jgi:hypothetical protein
VGVLLAALALANLVAITLTGHTSLISAWLAMTALVALGSTYAAALVAVLGYAAAALLAVHLALQYPDSPAHVRACLHALFREATLADYTPWLAIVSTGLAGALVLARSHKIGC